MKRVLVIGGGSAGKRHASCLQELRAGEVTIVSRFAEPGSGAIVRNLDDVNLENVDLAVIASPASRHLEDAWRLARAGKPVLVEKPLSLNLEGVREWMDFCETNKVWARVGYNFRFHPGLLALKRVIHEGRLGQLLWIDAYVGQNVEYWRPERDYRTTVSIRKELGGGCLLELSHEIDCLLYLGGPAAFASAHLRKLGPLEGDVEDFVEMDVEFRSGVRAHLHQDMIQYPFRRYCDAIFSEGTARWDFFANEVKSFRSGDFSGKTWWSDPDFNLRTTYLKEIEQFLGCLDGAEDELATVGEGAQVLEVIEAARRSSQSGGAQVSLDLNRKSH